MLKSPDSVSAGGRDTWSARLYSSLSKTRNKLGKELLGLFGGGQISAQHYEALENLLLGADMGIEATTQLLATVRERVDLSGLKNTEALQQALREALIELLTPLESQFDQLHERIKEQSPFVIMLVGVNGAGKTTTIGKLTHYFQGHSLSVLLAAGDTFRAAAREQLIAWGARNDVAVISQTGNDSAAICYDAIQAAQARQIDVVLADTAGRLPTQLHLMSEVAKVKRVMNKARPTAPNEIWLVLDANAGQNVLQQVKAFDDSLGLTGLILTKLDGTAKGGMIVAIAQSKAIPLYFIGTGETKDDLRPFVATDYVAAILDA